VAEDDLVPRAGVQDRLVPDAECRPARALGAPPPRGRDGVHRQRAGAYERSICMRPPRSPIYSADVSSWPDQTKDTLWAVAILSAPATVTIDTGDGQTQSFDGKAGLNKFSVPLTAGSTMAGTVARDGSTVAQVQGQGFTFDPNPKTYNFNAFVASS
jgi:hypothetical protein